MIPLCVICEKDCEEANVEGRGLFKEEEKEEHEWICCVEILVILSTFSPYVCCVVWFDFLPFASVWMDGTRLFAIFIYIHHEMMNVARVGYNTWCSLALFFASSYHFAAYPLLARKLNSTYLHSWIRNFSISLLWRRENNVFNLSSSFFPHTHTNTTYSFTVIWIKASVSLASW